MIRALIVLAVILLGSVALSVTAGPAYAGDWSSDCWLWHGTDDCQRMINGTRIPARGELRDKPRDCRVS